MPHVEIVKGHSYRLGGRPLVPARFDSREHDAARESAVSVMRFELAILKRGLLDPKAGIHGHKGCKSAHA